MSGSGLLYPQEESMIIRIERRQTYVIVDKHLVDDKRLSFKAKGLALYLFGKPDNWNANIRHLSTVGPDGGSAVQSALKELEDNGYLTRRRIQGEDGRFSWECILSENPCMENPCMENRDVIKNELVKKETTTTSVPTRSVEKGIDETDLDGKLLLQQIRDAGFMYLDTEAKRLAGNIESDYPPSVVQDALGKLQAAHDKQIHSGKRGITAPLAYMAAILRRNGDENPLPASVLDFTIGEMQ